MPLVTRFTVCTQRVEPSILKRDVITLVVVVKACISTPLLERKRSSKNVHRARNGRDVKDM
jgi:hypothetical protein